MREKKENQMYITHKIYLCVPIQRDLSSGVVMGFKIVKYESLSFP